MKVKQGLAHLLLFVTPIVAGGAIAASPSQAATLASSEASLKIDWLSQAPQDVRIITDARTDTLATDGTVTANADAGASAFTPNQPQGFSNFSKSITSGEGRSYLGQAQSFSAVIAFDFAIESGKTFSFNFSPFLDLNTSIDYPQYESASATGDLSFQLLDSTNGSLLDYFTISGNLATPGEGDALKVDKSSYVTFTPGDTLFKTSFGGGQESAFVSGSGRYSRTFANSTSLTLVEFKRNEASVKAAPEPSSTLGLLCLCSIGVVLGVRSKFSRKPQLALTQVKSNL